MSTAAQMEIDAGGQDGDKLTLLRQGAEARLYTCSFLGRPTIIKERFPKSYRHPILDKSLTQKRTKSEVRAMMKCRMIGIQTPAIYFVDLESNKIYMEYLKDTVTARDYIKSIQAAKVQVIEKLTPLAKVIGSTLGTMHKNNIIHGDLTTSNMLLNTQEESSGLLSLCMIDFGLGYVENIAEDKGVDLYVLERALLSTHPNTDEMFNTILESYKKSYGKGVQEVIKKFEEVRLRGRKRTMVG